MTDFGKAVQIPKEASDMAIKRNGTFAAVFLFPRVNKVTVVIKKRSCKI